MKDIAKILKDKSSIRLDIGGGGNPQGPNWVNIDYRPLPEVDIVHNLESFPWPLPADSVDVAVCSHVVEHINPSGGLFIEFMNEIWRVMKVDGQLAITTPYGGSARYLQDPTHINPCTEVTFSYFDPLDDLADSHLYSIYKPLPWKIEQRAWNALGDLQVVLKKRRIDPSYGLETKPQRV